VSAPDPLVLALTRRRLELGRPRRYVADKIGVAQITLQQWETGAREPVSIDCLRRWAQALGYRLALKLCGAPVTNPPLAPDNQPADPLIMLLRQRRYELRRTQLSVATQLGIGKSRFAQWETGDKRPQTIDLLRRWADALGLRLTLLAAPTARTAGVA
jgi:transcriptional regulator with XRE-family HTH domain